MKATIGKRAQTGVAGGGLPQLKRQFDQWRTVRRVGERIPPQMWDGAVSAAAEHGAYRVARELNLDYAVLKRRAAGVAGDAPASALATPRFVELLAPAGLSMPAPASQPECVVELVNARGARMRVELRGEGLHSLPALCNAFWSA
ncbi:MAG: hypothetical protein ACKPB2_24135 [Sphaerospermopsis kisseleviana]